MTINSMSGILCVCMAFILGGCAERGISGSSKNVYTTTEGILAVEAEDFYKQDRNEKRTWYLMKGDRSTGPHPDLDSSHASTSSGGAYLEILPDTRVTHDDELIRGENFSNEAGEIAVLYYKVHFDEPGRYYVWVRAHSSGTEDNGIHVGLDNQWPESGQRMQWCEGKRAWRWESKQRTEAVHCGEPWKIYLDIDDPGIHDIHFSMREDGFEFDKFIMTRDTTFRPTGNGPVPKLLVE